ncbi:hypothetical protein RQP46_002231 [Phenoliferia psychrophenolica]
MSSPPAYTLLPSSELEKAPALEPSPSAAFPTRLSAGHRGRLYALALAGVISLSTLVALLFYVPSADLLDRGRWSRLGCAGGARKASMTQDNLAIGEEHEELKDGEGREYPQYSTSVYPNGDTSSFEYTTRPIVNPGGYTIGTLTGYQHISASPRPSSSPTSPPTPTSPSSPYETEIEDLHIRHKRGFNFEDDAGEEEEAPVPTPTRIGETDYSYAREKNGDTSVYVKTTRAIVNPIGVSIGMLDGAYVRVGKYEPTPVPKIVVQNPKEGKWDHQELRRRGNDEAEELRAL